MGRVKKTEEAEGMDNITIATDAMEETRVEIPKKPVQEKVTYTKKEKETDNDEPVNCLRNEKVIVRFIAKSSILVSNPKHVLYGGMSETATRRFVVPRLSSTGLYVNVLTNNEMKFLEQAMGLEKGTLSIYRKKDNFWDDSNPEGIGKVILHKQDNYLDLSIPEDYIKYKILLANKNFIAKSLQELEDHPRETYQFVLISENAETNASLSRMDTIQRCYMEYGKMESNIHTMRVVIEFLEGRPLTNNVKPDFLKTKINEWIQRDPRQFIKIATDELLPAKVLIRRSVETGLIGKKNDTYYLRQDGTPLCEMNEESTLNNAAKYISSIKNQQLKYMLEAKVKD